MGPFAEVVCSMGREAAVSAAVAQLDEMFHNRGDELSASGEDGSQRTSAAANLINGELHDWAMEPFIHLGYTHPLAGAGAAPFAELAKPLPNGRVLFAGEAYIAEKGAANMTVHSALDAGVRAANEAAGFLRDIDQKNSAVPGREPRAHL